MEDNKVLELIRNNRNDTAFAKLYRYYPVVRKMVLANGGRSEDAEDIYQEALIVFYNKAVSPDFTLTSTINTYLYSICRFMWLERSRKQQQNPFIELQKDILPNEEFSEALQREEQFKLAEKVITELGERCRELLIMFYYKSMKLKAIASKMGYNSENTTKNQKYKCLEAAKNKLKTLKNETF